MNSIVRVKICCISSRAEASLSIGCGAAALGLVSEMPSGPGVIDEETIRDISAQVFPPISTFLLTSKQSVEDIIAQQRKCRTNTVQICDRLTNGDYGMLREALPGVGIVQVIHVGGEESVSEAMSVEDHVDLILLDSGDQSLKVKEPGGTGRTHNWEVSRQIRDAIRKPVFLAGGLHPENVAAAIHAVRPFGVDVCSGVRTNGMLDAAKLRAFVAAVGNATSGEA